MKQESNFELEIGGETNVKVEEGLATFQDQEMQTKVISEAIPPPMVPNPYPDQTPKQILERWYQTADTLSYTKTSSISYLDFKPFYNWIQSGATTGTTIYKALSSFRYLKWRSISVRIQFSSVPQIYGYVAACSLPYEMTLNSYSRAYLSFSDTTFLDFSVQDDVEMEIPWRHPDQWCDWFVQYQAGSSNEVDKLCALQLVNPLSGPVHVLDSTSTASVTLRFFVKLNDVETAGHVEIPGGSYTGQMKGAMNAFTRGINPNIEFRETITNDADHKSYFGTQSEGKAQNATAPDPEPDDPDLRNNPFGSLVTSHSRYVAGTGTQLAPCRDQTIREIISMPTCIEYGTIAFSDTLKLLHDFNIRGYSRINFMSQFFRMWRGSRKLTLVIFSTPFITARYNVVVAWGESAPSGYLGDEIIQDVTVRGTTKVEIEVPFLNSTQWLPTFWQVPDVYYSSNLPMPRIYLKVIQAPVTVGDVQPALPYVLYEQASPDFEFRSLINPNPNQDPDVTYQGQMKISTFGGGSYGSPKPLPNDSDTERTVGDMCRRWSGRGPDYPWPYPQKWYYTASTEVPSKGVFDWLSMIYGFWSGQIRFKLVIPETVAIACWHTRNHIGAIPFGSTYCNRPEDGMTNVLSDLTRVLDVTCPFLYTHQIMPLNTFGGTDPNTGDIATYANLWNIGSFPRIVWDGHLHDELGVDFMAEQVYVAGGSDFTYYFPVPPPDPQFWPSGSVQGIPNLESTWTEVKDHSSKKLKTTNATSSCTVTINSK